jgi:hypothetical protein
MDLEDGYRGFMSNKNRPRENTTTLPRFDGHVKAWRPFGNRAFLDGREGSAMGSEGCGEEEVSVLQNPYGRCKTLIWLPVCCKL